MTIRLSVVLPLYRVRSRIEVTLRALEQQTLDPSQFELIFVDDGSDDGTADAIEGWPTRLQRQVIRNPTNAGRSVSRNRGAARASGDILVFLDGDMIPDPGLLARYQERFGVGDCDVVSGRRRCIDLSASPAQDADALAALAGVPLDRLFDDPAADYARLRACSVLGQHPTALGAVLEEQIELVCRDHPGTLTCALAVITSNVAVRRDLYARTRGFFPGLVRTEDTDLGLQLAQIGARFAYDPMAEALHPFDVLNARPRDHQDSFAALLSRHPFIPVVLWWCWAMLHDSPPALVDIARAETEGTLADLDWERLARQRHLIVPAQPVIAGAALQRYWTSAFGVSEQAAAGYVSRAVSEGVLHVTRGDQILFDLMATTSWVGEHTDFRQHLYKSSFFSQRGAVPANGVPAGRAFRWRGRCEVDIPASMLEAGAVLNLPLPVPARCQSEVELGEWDPPELADHVRDGMILGYPIRRADAPVISVGYSFDCLVSEFDRSLPRGDETGRELWLRPLSYGEMQELTRLLARIRETAGPGAFATARAIYDWMLASTEQRANSLHSMMTVRTGIGHCIQLARLFVALCRLADIPARERSGVLIDRVRTGGGDLAAWTAEFYSPFGHTWAEFLCPDRGWTPVELIPIAHGRRAVTPWSFPDQALREQMIAEGDRFDAYYFGGLDPFRIHTGQWANQLPPLAIDDHGWKPVPDIGMQMRHRFRFDGERVK